MSFINRYKRVLYDKGFPCLSNPENLPKYVCVIMLWHFTFLEVFLVREIVHTKRHPSIPFHHTNKTGVEINVGMKRKTIIKHSPTAMINLHLNTQLPLENRFRWNRETIRKKLTPLIISTFPAHEGKNLTENMYRALHFTLLLQTLTKITVSAGMSQKQNILCLLNVLKQKIEEGFKWVVMYKVPNLLIFKTNPVFDNWILNINCINAT